MASELCGGIMTTMFVNQCSKGESFEAFLGSMKKYQQKERRSIGTRLVRLIPLAVLNRD